MGVVGNAVRDGAIPSAMNTLSNSIDVLDGAVAEYLNRTSAVRKVVPAASEQKTPPINSDCELATKILHAAERITAIKNIVADATSTLEL